MVICPNCGKPFVKIVGRGRVHCVNCRHEWTPSPGDIVGGDGAIGGSKPAVGAVERVARGLLYVVFGVPLFLSFLGIVPAVMSGQKMRALIAFTTLVFCCAPISLARYRARAQGFVWSSVLVMIAALVGAFIGYRTDTALFGLPGGNMLLPGLAAGGFVGFIIDLAT